MGVFSVKKTRPLAAFCSFPSFAIYYLFIYFDYVMVSTESVRKGDNSNNICPVIQDLPNLFNRKRSLRNISVYKTCERCRLEVMLTVSETQNGN